MVPFNLLQQRRWHHTNHQKELGVQLLGLNPSSSIPASISLWAADFTSLFPVSVSVGWGGNNVGYLSILVEIKMLTIQVTTVGMWLALETTKFIIITTTSPTV